MNEQDQPSIQNKNELPKIIGFEYPPFSILYNPPLQKMHQYILNCGRDPSTLETAQWLYNLTPPISQSRRFFVYSDDFPNTYLPSEPILSDTEALLIYTTAKLEHHLRVQRVTEPEDIDKGISMMLSRELAQLSNAFQARFKIDNTRITSLVLAQELAMFSLRFRRPDGTGYIQNICHWLDLGVKNSVSPGIEDEERIKLSLALSEIGDGPQDIYSKRLAEKLALLYSFNDEPDKAEQLQAHFKNIPIVKSIPDQYWEQEFL